VILWRKSSYSAGGANCVEVALGTTIAAVRDSKCPESGQLAVGTEAFHLFVDSLKKP
jgi:hypothetical protein